MDKPELEKAPSSKLHSDQVIVPNGGIYLEQTGQGKPLILIHAGFSDRRDWTHQINRFGERYHTIAYDQRGCGKSSTIKVTFSPTEDLQAVIQAMGIEKTALIGHSIGGTIAIDFALQYPQSVSALVLIASGINGYQWSTEYLTFMQSIWQSQQPVTMTKQFLSSEMYAIAMANSEISHTIKTITQENFHKVLTWETFNPNDIRWFHQEATAKLAEITVPTLIIYGDNDSQDIKDIASLLNNQMRNADMTHIENTDHLINFEDPIALNNIILAYLSKINY